MRRLRWKRNQRSLKSRLSSIGCNRAEQAFDILRKGQREDGGFFFALFTPPVPRIFYPPRILGMRLVFSSIGEACLRESEICNVKAIAAWPCWALPVNCVRSAKILCDVRCGSLGSGSFLGSEIGAFKI